jgi:predicted dehydrogenase
MKFGIVGYGSIGQRHAKNLRKLGHQTEVYDPALITSDVRREVHIYDNKSIDAVVICTPSPYHEGPLRACVERGKHIFVEKPISTSVGMLPQLLSTADSKDLVVMVGTNLRFHGSVRRVESWLHQDMAGKPLWANFICAQLNEKYRDSVILNWGAHEVDLAIHFFGLVDTVLSATAHAVNDGVEDIADFTLLHKSGVRSSFHLDYITPNEIREAWIVGEHKNIGLDLVNRRSSLGEFVQHDPGSFDDDYLEEMKAFAARVERQAVTPGSSGWRGLEVLETLVAVRKKAGLL